MTDNKIRYGVVGLGWFAQSAILPAFARAENSQLVALFSEDAEKLTTLGARYAVPHLLSYEDYDSFLSTGQLDAVYIALPNALHADYAVRAAQRGVHVLCEKPLAVTEDECERILDAVQASGVKLMTAYRLHFEAANLTAIDLVHGGEIGVARAFNAAFTMQVEEGNSRLSAGLGGGPLYDIGIYCINAARNMFGEEPIEVCAMSDRKPNEARFDEVDEQVAVLLRFPGGKLATFVAGFGAASASHCEVIGTQGSIRLDPAFHHTGPRELVVEKSGDQKRRKYKATDQVAPEIIYFSDCILEGHEPEPSGVEGLADVRIIRAIVASATSGRAIELEPVHRISRPSLMQARSVPAHREPSLVNVQAPTR